MTDTPESVVRPGWSTFGQGWWSFSAGAVVIHVRDAGEYGATVITPWSAPLLRRDDLLAAQLAAEDTLRTQAIAMLAAIGDIPFQESPPAP